MASKGLKKSIQIARRNKHITPKVNAWLMRNPSGVQVYDREVLDRIIDLMTPEGDPKGRHGAFHPSQLYQCHRAQVFGYMNLPVLREYNPVLLNLFNDGHYRHLRWQTMLLAAGVLTHIEVPVYNADYRLEGSMDGLNADEGWMFELKGTSQYRQIQTRGVIPAHVRQVHAYLFATGLERAIIVYEDKMSQDWTEIEIQRDESLIAEITTTLEALNHAIDNEELPAIKPDCANQEGYEFGGCPYSSVCLGIKSYEQAASLVQVG